LGKLQLPPISVHLSVHINYLKETHSCNYPSSRKSQQGEVKSENLVSAKNSHVLRCKRWESVCILYLPLRTCQQHSSPLRLYIFKSCFRFHLLVLYQIAQDNGCTSASSSFAVDICYFPRRCIPMNEINSLINIHK